MLYKEQMFWYTLIEQLFKEVIDMLIKKYRIVNRIRFITFLVACILVISCTVTAALNLIIARAEVKPEYAEIKVVYGDTLWELAKTYGDQSKDVRQVVYEICNINNIKAEDLRAGQTILIPIN